MVEGVIGIVVGCTIAASTINYMHWRYPLYGRRSNYPWNWRVLLPWPPAYYNWLNRRS